jgi:AcrR family transcriptional regulator
MNDRKQHVIKKAHQLFIDKGFQNTSIQDILDFTGISKGTFYNYFSSKNELLMSIFKTAFQQMENNRNAMLVGQDDSDPEIFIKQIEFQMKTNRENNIIPLFEEVFFSSDHELKQYLEIGNMKTLRWAYERLTDITDESSHPYLLDAAVMLRGILQQNIRLHLKAYGVNAEIHPVVRYSVNRILSMLKELAITGERLLSPEILDQWLPASKSEDLDFRTKIHSAISRLKKLDCHNYEFLQKLDFIEEEIIKTEAPRKFLIDSVLLSMANIGENKLAELKELIDDKLLDKA